MKKIFLTLILSSCFVILFSQDFFRGDFNKERDYVILTNPTVGNIELVKFLLDKKLLDIDRDRVDFVGVYHSGQAYDFSKTIGYLKEQPADGFHLHEIRGELSEGSLFIENECTSEFRLIFRHSAGIFFFGGPDIPPSVYGEENTYSVITDPVRHYFELSFLFHLTGGSRNTSYTPLLGERPDYLVTGFCLGMQTMNVAAGGTLFQDIPVQLYNRNEAGKILALDRSEIHRNYWHEINDDTSLMKINFHPIKFSENPFFGQRIKVSKNLQPLIYSSHHQSVKKLAEGYEVTAISMDGKVVEGIVHRKFPNVFAVQFHPEVSALYENREKWKFSPYDKPRTFHQIMDRKSLKFHKKYWFFISEAMNNSLTRQGNSE